MTTEFVADLPILEFSNPTKWRLWLHENYAQSSGIWLRFYKKDSGVPSLNYLQALDEALCYGWIDGQLQKGDEKSWLQRFTPRRSKSNWSLKNTTNAERLIAEGSMQPAGQHEVDAARKDGRWQAAYASQSKGKIPDDFLRELQQNPVAYDFYKTLNKANLYAIYYRLHTAKKRETRENRKKMIIAMFEKGQPLHS